MKKFRCGDVVPNCQTTFTATDENGILSAVAAHARVDHGLVHVSPDLVAAVRRSITAA